MSIIDSTDRRIISKQLLLTIGMSIGLIVAYLSVQEIHIPIAVVGLLFYALTGFTLGMYASYQFSIHPDQRSPETNNTISRGYFKFLMVVRSPPGAFGWMAVRVLQRTSPHTAHRYGQSPLLYRLSINPVIATILPGMMCVWILALWFDGWTAWWRTVIIVAIGAGLGLLGLGITLLWHFRYRMLLWTMPH